MVNYPKVIFLQTDGGVWSFNVRPRSILSGLQGSDYLMMLIWTGPVVSSPVSDVHFIMTKGRLTNYIENLVYFTYLLLNGVKPQFAVVSYIQKSAPPSLKNTESFSRRSQSPQIVFQRSSWKNSPSKYLTFFKVSHAALSKQIHMQKMIYVLVQFARCERKINKCYFT